MSIDTRHDAQNPPAALDPFRIGYRYVPGVGPDGVARQVMVPLTEEDFLHPQEEDREMLTDLHTVTVNYLREAIEILHESEPEVRVFTDHRVDWQVPGIAPHGPDVVVFDNFHADWDPLRGTLPVRDLGARVMAVIEVTSEATRATDFEAKFIEYHEAGIPYYVIVDAAGPAGAEKVLAFRRSVEDYKPLPRDAQLGCFLPRVNVWLRWADDRLIATTEAGHDILTGVDLARRADAESQRADEATQVAGAEKQRADEAIVVAQAEKLRADEATQEAGAEKQRADEATERAEALARELAALKARLNDAK